MPVNPNPALDAAIQAPRPPHTLAALVGEKAVEHPDLTILTFVAIGADGEFSEERRTYGGLNHRAQRLAGALQTLGLGQGDRFAIMMNNHPEFVEAMLAAALLGAVFVPIDPRTVGDKLAYMMTHAGCAGVLCADYSLDAVLAVTPNLPHLGWVVVVGEPGAATERPPLLAYEQAIADAQPRRLAAQVERRDTMFLLFTSGTTGAPKAVEQTHGQYMQAAAGLSALGVGPRDVLYTGLSLTHINAQGTLRAGLALGLPVVISRKFTKSRLWDICRAYGCTVFNLLGGMIPEVFAVPPRPDDADNPVRLIISAGMPASLWNAYRERFGVEICEVYGATEGGGAMFNTPGLGGPVGSMGRPPPNLEAAVFDQQDRRLAPGEFGELRFRRKDGGATKVSYYQNAPASSDKVRDGWFRTGDIVHQDEDGWFFFHHRAGGGVRRNGDFVNTALVEAAITRSGLIADVYVFGVQTPCDVAGEKTLAALVTPVDPSAFSRDALVEYCRAHLERRDVPEIIHAVAAIPKTVSEKPIERASVELLKQAGILTAE